MTLSIWKFAKDIFLAYLPSNDNENLVGLVNFDFLIL